MMRKGPKSAAVLAVMVITVFALYYYLVNKVERSSPEVETTAIQDVLLRNLETDYPATVREVIKYYNEIMSCYYSESPTDEELKDLADKALELYDTELVNFQSEEMYLADLKTEIAGFASSGTVLSHVALSSSTAVDYFTYNGRECAQIRCIYTMRQKTSMMTIKEIYVLRKDDNGRWKILGWTPAEDETTE
ncbi:MAG: hypothetical protein HFI11_07025 [Lachnospiraceae bacterium]|jgi:hypothetical protein|nr:hypothetical protein [Lachnospiraceae bacterium]